MPTVSVFDFRRGLDLFTTVENSPPDISPSMRNVFPLANGHLVKRRGQASVESSGAFSYPSGIKKARLLENLSKKEHAYNHHFGDWSGGVPGSWTIDANANVAQVTYGGAAVHEVEITLNPGAAKEGIRQQIFNDFGDDGRYAYYLDVEFKIAATAGKRVKVQILDGTTVKFGKIFTGTGGLGSSSTTYTVITDTATFYTYAQNLGQEVLYLEILLEDENTTARLDYISVKPTRIQEIEVSLKLSDEVSTSLYSISTGGEYYIQSIFEGGNSGSMPVFKNRVYLFPEYGGSSNSFEPVELGLADAVRSSSVSDYSFPSSWGSTSAGVGYYPDFPRYAAVMRVGNALRMIAAKTTKRPAYLWFSDLENAHKWSDTERAGPFDPGFIEVGSPYDEITGVAVWGQIIVVSKKTRIYWVRIDEAGPFISEYLDVGCRYHSAMVNVFDQLYILSNVGVIRLNRGPEERDQREKYDILSKPVSKIIDSIDFSYETVGFHNEKEKTVNWWVYLDSQYKILSYHYRYGSFSLHTFDSSCQSTPISSDYSKTDEIVYFVQNKANSNFCVLNIGKDTSQDDAPTTGASAMPVDCSYKTPVFHLGDLEGKKDWKEFTLFYNTLSSHSAYPFTITIDRNPLLYDSETVPDSERYIRITNKVEIGDGTTWSTAQTTSGFSVGDITDPYVDRAKTYGYKIFNFRRLGKSRALQIEFSDNRTGTDFIIMGYMLTADFGE